MKEIAENELRGVLSDVFHIPQNEVGEETSIDTVEVWDSLKHLELVLALEAKFDISFSVEETTEILNYSLIKMTLEKHGIRFIRESCATEHE